MIRIGVDTGGTFTDFVFFDGAEIRIHKVPSTPDNPSRAIISGLNFLLDDGFNGIEIVHGTTVATNALLERKGARIALVTTKGFEDVIEIGRQNRPHLYRFSWKPVDPLVPRELRFGVEERTAYSGEIVKAVDADEIRELSLRLKELGIEGVAVSLLHSYANPQNEVDVERGLREGLQGLGVPITLSSRLLPEFREYERTSTVAANAYLLPKVKAYLDELAGKLGGAAVDVMQSSGGVARPSQAGQEPVSLLLSGPAGGVVGGFQIAHQMGYERVITYDMGGTSTDVALVDGALRFTTEAVLDGLPIKTPMIDVATIGAGGGSIAYVDAGGALKVGPVSAGAYPGPACYGVGDEPTVTDANVVLGRIRPEWFLGGRMTIDPGLSRSAVRGLAEGLGVSLVEAAEGVISVSNSNMEKALRLVSIEKGYDPRDFALVSFGGAGGLHACELALAMGLKAVIFPVAPGALSAMGMLMADSFKDYGKTCFVGADDPDAASLIESAFAELEQRAREELRGENTAFKRFIDARYKRQSYELTIPMSGALVDDFHKAHQRSYGYMKPESPVEFVTVRLRAVMEKERLKLPRLDSPRGGGEASPERKTIIYDGKRIDACCYSRADLYEGFTFEGPALVLEETATSFVLPGFRCAVDGFGNVVALPE